jgi:hypothetical protein
VFLKRESENFVPLPNKSDMKRIVSQIQPPEECASHRVPHIMNRLLNELAGNYQVNPLNLQIDPFNPFK